MLFHKYINYIQYFSMGVILFNNNDLLKCKAHL